MKKEYEPVNCLAKLYKDPFGLKDAVNKSINDITKGKSFKRPTELANSYLEKLGACPKHLRTVSNMEEAYKNLIKVSAKLNPQEAKSIRCELKRVKKEIFDKIEIHGDYGEYFIDFIFINRNFYFIILIFLSSLYSFMVEYMKDFPKYCS